MSATQQMNVFQQPVSERTKAMKPFTTIASVIFIIVAILHLLRLLQGWEIIANGMLIPMWVSLFGCVLPAVLAFMLWKEAHK
jgi:Na+/proline symporter